MVHNHQLITQYQEKRREMRQNGYSEKDVADSFAFVCVEKDHQVRKICEQGLTVGNTSVTCLGNPEMGVSLCRHADIIRHTGIFHGFMGKIIIFKYMKGKIKSMVENYSGEGLDPTPNYDCHVSKTANINLTSTDPLKAFESTQLYIYEYDEDLEIQKRPRQVCPFAVVHFKYRGETKLHRPAPQRQSSKSSMRGTAGLPRGSPQVAPSPGSMSQGRVSMVPSPASSQKSQPSPVSVSSSSPSSPSIKTPPPGLHHRPPLPLSATGDKPVTSPGVRSTVSPGVMPKISQAGRSVASPGVPSAGMHQVLSPSLASPNVRPGLSPAVTSPGVRPVLSPGVASPSVRPALPPSSSVGTSVHGTGCVVWSGHLSSKSTPICDVELVAYGTSLKPAQIGPQLNIVSRLPVLTLKAKYAAGISTLRQQGEVKGGDKYYRYCQLRPMPDGHASTPDGHTKFSEIRNHLALKECVGLVKLDTDGEVLILANCDVTQNMGVSQSHLDPLVLHCIFVSGSSRTQVLMGKSSGSRQASNAQQRMLQINQQSFSGGDGVDPRKQAFQDIDLRRLPSSQMGDNTWGRAISDNVAFPNSMFKEPPKPTRVLKDSDQLNSDNRFDDGFEKFVPVNSLVYKDVLVKAFSQQMRVQEQHNIDKVKQGELIPYASIMNAERLMGAGMEPSPPVNTDMGPSGMEPVNSNLSSPSLGTMANMAGMSHSQRPGLLPTPVQLSLTEHHLQGDPRFSRQVSPPAYPGISEHSQGRFPHAHHQMSAPRHQMSAQSQQDHLQTDFGQPPGITVSLPQQQLYQHQMTQQMSPSGVVDPRFKQQMAAPLIGGLHQQISSPPIGGLHQQMSMPPSGGLQQHIPAGIGYTQSTSATSTTPGYLHTSTATSSLSTNPFDDAFIGSNSVPSMVHNPHFSHQNLPKSLSVGTVATPGSRLSSKTPGNSTGVSMVTKPRPTEGRTADTSNNTSTKRGLDDARKMPPPQSPRRDLRPHKENLHPSEASPETGSPQPKLTISALSPQKSGIQLSPSSTGSTVSPPGLGSPIRMSDTKYSTNTSLVERATQLLSGGHTSPTGPHNISFSSESETEMTDDLADKIIRQKIIPANLTRDPRSRAREVVPVTTPARKLYQPTPKYQPTPIRRESEEPTSPPPSQQQTQQVVESEEEDCPEEDVRTVAETKDDMRAMLGEYEDSDSSHSSSDNAPLPPERSTENILPTEGTTEVVYTASDMKSFLNAEIEKKRKLRAQATQGQRKKKKEEEHNNKEDGGGGVLDKTLDTIRVQKDTPLKEKVKTWFTSRESPSEVSKESEDCQVILAEPQSHTPKITTAIHNNEVRDTPSRGQSHSLIFGLPGEGHLDNDLDSGALADSEDEDGSRSWPRKKINRSKNRKSSEDSNQKYFSAKDNSPSDKMGAKHSHASKAGDLTPEGSTKKSHSHNTKSSRNNCEQNKQSRDKQNSTDSIEFTKSKQHSDSQHCLHTNNHGDSKQPNDSERFDKSQQSSLPEDCANSKNCGDSKLSTHSKQCIDSEQLIVSSNCLNSPHAANSKEVSDFDQCTDLKTALNLNSGYKKTACLEKRVTSNEKESENEDIVRAKADMQNMSKHSQSVPPACVPPGGNKQKDVDSLKKSDSKEINYGTEPDASERPILEGWTVSVGDQPEDMTIALLWDPDDMTDVWEVDDEEDLIEMCTISVLQGSRPPIAGGKNVRPEDEDKLITSWFFYLHALLPGLDWEDEEREVNSHSDAKENRKPSRKGDIPEIEEVKNQNRLVCDVVPPSGSGVVPPSGSGVVPPSGSSVVCSMCGASFVPVNVECPVCSVCAQQTHVTSEPPSGDERHKKTVVPPFETISKSTPKEIKSSKKKDKNYIVASHDPRENLVQKDMKKLKKKEKIEIEESYKEKQVKSSRQKKSSKELNTGDKQNQIKTSKSFHQQEKEKKSDRKERSSKLSEDIKDKKASRDLEEKTSKSKSKISDSKVSHKTKGETGTKSSSHGDGKLQTKEKYKKVILSKKEKQKIKETLTGTRWDSRERLSRISCQPNSHLYGVDDLQDVQVARDNPPSAHLGHDNHFKRKSQSSTNTSINPDEFRQDKSTSITNLVTSAPKLSKSTQFSKNYSGIRIETKKADKNMEFDVPVIVISSDSETERKTDNLSSVHLDPNKRSPNDASVKESHKTCEFLEDEAQDKTDLGNLSSMITIDEIGDLSHMTEIGDPSHLTEIGDPSNMTEIGDPSHMTEIGDPSHMTEIGDPSHMTAIGDPSHMIDNDNNTVVGNRSLQDNMNHSNNENKSENGVEMGRSNKITDASDEERSQVARSLSNQAMAGEGYEGDLLKWHPGEEMQNKVSGKEEGTLLEPEVKHDEEKALKEDETKTVKDDQIQFPDLGDWIVMSSVGEDEHSLSTLGQKSSINEHKSSTLGQKSSVNEHKSSTLGQKSSAGEHKSSTLGQKSSVNEHMSPTLEHKSPTLGPRTSNEENKSSSLEQKSSADKNRSSTLERKSSEDKNKRSKDAGDKRTVTCGPFKPQNITKADMINKEGKDKVSSARTRDKKSDLGSTVSKAANPVQDTRIFIIKSDSELPLTKIKNHKNNVTKDGAVVLPPGKALSLIKIQSSGESLTKEGATVPHQGKVSGVKAGVEISRDKLSTESSASRRADSRHGRQYHPYRRPAPTERSESEAFKMYQSTEDLDELLNDLTAKKYYHRGPRLVPMSLSSRGRVVPPARFRGFVYKRTHGKIRTHDEAEEFYQQSDIPDFEQRRERSEKVEPLQREEDEGSGGVRNKGKEGDSASTPDGSTGETSI